MYPRWQFWSRREAMQVARSYRRSAADYQRRIRQENYRDILAAEIEELKEIVALIDREYDEHDLGTPVKS